jgi:broad specificity phosphatase PhoE
LSTEQANDDARSARLWLVRHAQASFGSGDYDRLSERGHSQAQILAEWMCASDLRFDKIVCGAQQRHRQTLAAITTAFAAATRPLPEAMEDADWNEFDHEAVVRAYARLRSDDALIDAARQFADQRNVHALLAAALGAWARGELDSAVPETWAEFGARVARARSRVGSGKVLVITSGGPVTQCAQAALGCAATVTVPLSIALRNTAVSEFRGAPSGWQMLVWNSLPHFARHDHREWVTYY